MKFMITILAVMTLCLPAQAQAPVPADGATPWRWIITCVDHDDHRRPTVLQERSTKPISHNNLFFRVWDEETETYIGLHSMGHRIVCRSEARKVFERRQ